LIARGITIELLARDDRYLSLDTEATLDEILRDGQLDSNLFFEPFDRVLDRARISPGATVRDVSVFGGLVALLTANAHTSSALAVENSWNELAERSQFSLLCAYSMGLFSGPHDAAMLSEICDRQRRVIPAEGYS